MKLWLFGGCLALLALVFSASQNGWAASEPTKDSRLARADGQPARTDRAEAGYRGGLVTPPIPKPKFVLTDTSGAAFDFAAETEGYVALLFFGFTNCPQECPLHLATIAMSLQQIPANARDQVKVVFVTADPARDSAKILRAYLDQFDRRFIGLTGNEAAVVSAQRAAHVPAATKTLGANKDYDVAHASFVLAYTKDNLAHVIYPSGISASDWAHDLPLLVKEAWSRD